jgi:hypothetical protein
MGHGVPGLPSRRRRSGSRRTSPRRKSRWAAEAGRLDSALALRRFPTVSRCPRGVTVPAATSHGGSCASECCMRQRTRLFGLPGPAMASSFPSRLRGIPTVSVGRRLSHPAHPLVRFAPPAESLESRPARRSRPGFLPGAFRPSSRHQPAESTGTSVPGSYRSVLDVSHVLDGFLLHRPSRVCFTPQPRPGFALQGFPLTRSRASSSPAVALLSFAPGPCSRLPGRARTLRPPSGLCSSRQSVAARHGLGCVLLDPLLSFFLPRVFLRTPSGDLHRPSDHGLPRPPSCSQCPT